jgi:hypothetical protein
MKIISGHRQELMLPIEGLPRLERTVTRVSHYSITDEGAYCIETEIRFQGSTRIAYLNITSQSCAKIALFFNT